MIDKQNIIRFILKCFLIYSFFLLISSMGFGDSYSQHFRLVSQQLVQPMAFWGLTVQFLKNTGSDQKKYDTKMVLINKDTADYYIAKARLGKIKKVRINSNTSSIDIPSYNVTFNSLRQGFIPSILLLALIIATPIRFRWRKVGALLWGMVLMHCFIAFKLIVWMGYKCSLIDYLGFSIANSPIWKEIFYYLYLVFLEDMPMRFIMPVLIWILVCFRKEDILKTGLHHPLFGS